MARRIFNPTGRRKVLPPVHPNAGVEAAFRAKLDKLVGEMQRSLVRWLTAAYRAEPPENSIATDASPAVFLNRAMARLARRWQRKFDLAAPEMGAYFAQAAGDRSDAALRAILKKSGIAVEFRMTDKMNDAIQATIAENVGLIRSIAQEHLQEVQGLVMRSVQRGADLKTLTDVLEHRYGITRRRAAFIATNQNARATAMINVVRQRELGLRKAIWMHSAGGRKPRASHVKAGRDQLEYDVDKGAYIDGDWIFPGELPRCRCVSRAVLPPIPE